MRQQRGQSTVEYAVVVAVIIAALLAMQIYMKRGTMGKLREATDQIGEQFDPKSAAWNATLDGHGARTESLQANGAINTTNINESFSKNWNGTFSGNNIANENLY